MATQTQTSSAQINGKLFEKKTASETQFNKTSGDIIGSKTVKLSRAGILIQDYEEGAAVSGGIIYWNGKLYIWYIKVNESICQYLMTVGSIFNAFRQVGTEQ